MNGAIVCLVVCGVMNKASMCGTSVCDIMSLLVFIGKEQTNMAAPWEAKMYFPLAKILIE